MKRPKSSTLIAARDSGAEELSATASTSASSPSRPTRRAPLGTDTETRGLRTLATASELNDFACFLDENC